VIVEDVVASIGGRGQHSMTLAESFARTRHDWIVAFAVHRLVC
jgi:hypothetical protein